ncbi:FG-GAP-like repeat-containing protein [Streptomyces sp. NPDC048224]|uniref:FG-GAP-like repeat-containing protein n=1 Tax=Streptomyces sp. NPDC048224 TaxID=3154500 RepID=UPI0033F92C09
MHTSLRGWRHALSGASLLLALATTIAHATPAPDPAITGTSPAYEWVDAKTVPPAQLEPLGSPQPFADYQREHTTEQQAAARPRQSFPTSQSDDLRTECSLPANKGDANTATGWIKSRFESCTHRPYDLELRSTDGKQTIGRLWFDMWVLGFTYDGDRRADYVVSIENITVQTANGEDATKWRIFQQFRDSISASGSDPNPHIKAPKQTDRDGLIGEWETQPQWTLTYTAPDMGPLFNQGNQQRVKALVQMSLSVSSPSSRLTYQEVDAFHSNIRFDYAGPTAGKHKGTVFTEARITFRPRLDDPEGWENARHIYDALHHPERTFPSLYPKSIPGEKEPLHRQIDSAEVEKNRKAANATCRDVWGDYDGERLNCDEYPFASTYEGANKGDRRYSARLIDADDNQKVGRDLNNQFYTVHRVLDNDAFYVAVDGDPTAPPPRRPDTTPPPRSNDMNGDGKADLLAIDTSGKLYFYPGKGDGTLGSRTLIGTGGWTGASISHRGDWNGDGKEDVIARIGSEIRIYPGKGDGTLGAPSGLNGALGDLLPNTAQIASIGDLNNDGYPDLVANYNGNLWLLAGDPARKPAVKPAVKISAGWAAFTLSALGDSNGDGKADLLARHTTDGTLWFHPGTGTGFGPRTVYGKAGWTTTNRPLLAAGDDADGNGLADLWATTGEGKLLFYRGAKDANGNPTDGPSAVIGTGGWNVIKMIS